MSDTSPKRRWFRWSLRTLRLFTIAGISTALAISAWLIGFHPMFVGVILAWTIGALILAEFLGPVAGLVWSGFVGLAVAILFVWAGLRFSKPPAIATDVLLVLLFSGTGVLAGHCLNLFAAYAFRLLPTDPLPGRGQS